MSELLSIKAEALPGVADSRTELGSLGEKLAAEHLVAGRYRLVLSNFKVPVGRNSRGVQVTGEIDIVALDGDTLCFVEVKTRRSNKFTPVITNVDLRKQRQIIRTARIYRRTFGLWDVPHRYDVVTVLMPLNASPTVEIVKGFWSEEKFRKRKWYRGDWLDH